MANATVSKNDDLTIEERLEPWLDQAEYLLFFVIGVMVWSAILVNLAGFIASQLAEGLPAPMRAVAGVVFVVPAFGLWLYPIFSLKGLARAKRGLAYLQNNPLAALVIYGIFGFIIFSGFNRSLWSPYPLVQICIVILLVMFTLAILFLQPDESASFQTWRKVLAGIIGLYIVAEIVLHILVVIGVLSIAGDSGVGMIYGRVATQDETINISRSNNYGWHYTDFRLEDDTQRILLHGDTFVQALQVPVTNHTGKYLESLLNPGADTEEDIDLTTEVLAQGMPGYGPSMYLNDNMAPYIWEPLEPDETIIFFHLLNDFQIESTLDERIAYSYLTDNLDDRAVVSDTVWNQYHWNSHFVIGGHDPVAPYSTILSYSMVWNLGESFLGGRLDQQPLTMDSVSDDAPFGDAGLLYDTGAVEDETGETYAIARAILADYVDRMADLDVTVRMVTIPYFPAQFYEMNSGSEWDTTIDSYDLALPEAEMRSIADELGIDFLGMVNYLQATDVDMVQSYFFENGTGHLTVAGHQAFAEAVYACFYSEADVAGCEVED